MVAIKDIKMPSCCAECEYIPNYCSYCLRLHQAIPRDIFNTSRLSNCPLIEIEESKVEKCKSDVHGHIVCTDCNEYNQEKHYCPKFCNVIRDTTKEMQEFYKGEHEKLERIEQIVNEWENSKIVTNCYECAEQIKEVLEQE